MVTTWFFGQAHHREEVAPGRFGVGKQDVVASQFLEHSIVPGQDGIDDSLVLKQKGDQIMNNSRHPQVAARLGGRSVETPFLERTEDEENVECVRVHPGKAVHAGSDRLTQVPARPDGADGRSVRGGYWRGGEVFMDIENILVLVVSPEQRRNEVAP